MTSGGSAPYTPRNAPAGSKLFDVAPWKARVCIYRTPADNFATGHFVRGFKLDVSRTRRLIRTLGGPGPRRGCPKQRAFATVGGGHGFGATVELGGCWRVAWAAGARTANPAVVRSILGGR